MCHLCLFLTLYLSLCLSFSSVKSVKSCFQYQKCRTQIRFNTAYFAVSGSLSGRSQRTNSMKIARFPWHEYIQDLKISILYGASYLVALLYLEQGPTSCIK